MSHNQVSYMMKRKNMDDYSTSEEKLKKIKLQDIQDDIKYFTYKEKKVHNPDDNTFEDFYHRLFKKNKIVQEKKEKKEINFVENRTLNYLRTTKNLKRKPIREWELLKGDVKKIKHSDIVKPNIKECEEARKKNLENKTLNKNKSVISEEKIVISTIQIKKKDYNLTEEQKKFKIIFPHTNEREENEYPFFSNFIEEKDNFKMKSDKVLKIKQEGKKKLCAKCNKMFRADFINRHKSLHRGKFYFFQSNLSSIQINQIKSNQTSCFEFYDFDKLSNFDQIERNKQIKQFAQVANQNNKILCFLSRFQKELSLHTTRLKFWSFPKKQINFSMQANKANFFSRHNCDMKKTFEINSLFSQNDSLKHPITLYNLLKLDLSQRTKLYIVFEYLQKVGTFRFVNFHVKSKHKHTKISKKRTKRNVQHLPNCLQIKKKDFNFIFNYFDELKVINVEEHLNISRKKRRNGIFSGQYNYLDLCDIERVSKQFHTVHQIDTIFNCLNVTNHYEIMGTLFNQMKKKFGSNFYSISSFEAEKFYGSRLQNIQKPIMSYVLNQLVKNNDKNVDSSIIDSTKHFLNKYYVPYEIQCFKKDCSKLTANTCLFKQASNVKKSKEYKKYERFEKKKKIKNRQEWLMLQKKFDREYPNGGNAEQVKNFMKKQIKIFKNTEEIKSNFESKVNKLTSYVPVDCSSMQISRQKRELPSWSDFMSKLRENSFKRQANARRKKKELEMPFRNLQKFYKETFFEFSERCYFILEKVERTFDNKIIEQKISERIFDKIYFEILETKDMLDKFLFYYMNSKDIIMACHKFDNHLKNTNCDHLITLEF